MRDIIHAVRQNRVSRWAAIAIALNAWVIFGIGFRYLVSDRTVTIWPAASDVQPYLDPNSREVDHYTVNNVDVAEVTRWTDWPSYVDLLLMPVLNLALFAWLLKLKMAEQGVGPPEGG